LVPAALVVVRGEAVGTALRKAGEQALDGAERDRELPSHGVRVSLLLPEAKKVGYGWEPVEHWA
jgi:hypothetical protein